MSDLRSMVDDTSENPLLQKLFDELVSLEKNIADAKARSRRGSVGEGGKRAQADSLSPLSSANSSPSPLRTDSVVAYAFLSSCYEPDSFDRASNMPRFGGPNGRCDCL